MKSSPGLQRIEIHWNSAQKEAPQVKKAPGTVKTELQTMVCDKIVFWSSTYLDTLKQSSKRGSAGRKIPRYSQNRATNYGLRQNRLRGMSVSRYTEILLKNVLRGSKKVPGSLKFALQTMVWDQIDSSGHQRVDVYQNSL